MGVKGQMDIRYSRRARREAPGGVEVGGAGHAAQRRHVTLDLIWVDAAHAGCALHRGLRVLFRHSEGKISKRARLWLAGSVANAESNAIIVGTLLETLG